MSGDEQALLQRQIKLLRKLEGISAQVADDSRLSGLFEHILDYEAHDTLTMRQNAEQRLKQVQRRKQKQR